MNAAKSIKSADISATVPTVVLKLGLSGFPFSILLASSGLPLNTHPGTPFRLLGRVPSTLPVQRCTLPANISSDLFCAFQPEVGNGAIIAACIERPTDSEPRARRLC